MTKDIREQLAVIEHEQWVTWSKTIAPTLKLFNHHPDIKARLARWEKLWVPYSELSEEEKNKDREWADKVLAVMNGAK